jgi:hypothetical protein
LQGLLVASKLLTFVFGCFGLDLQFLRSNVFTRIGALAWLFLVLATSSLARILESTCATSHQSFDQTAAIKPIAAQSMRWKLKATKSRMDSSHVRVCSDQRNVTSFRMQLRT